MFVSMSSRNARPFVALAFICAAACGKSTRDPPPTASGKSTRELPLATSEPPPLARDIDSKEILARTEAAPQVFVKDVLISWSGLPVYGTGSRQDPRGASRSNAQAAAIALDTLTKLTADPRQIDVLVDALSEDQRAISGDPFEITPTTKFTPEIKQLALRLKIDEAGIVRSAFGYHVIERVMPQPDPIESAGILARKDYDKGLVYVRYVLIGWKGAWTGARGATRTKAEADKLAKRVLAMIKAGEDMPKLMKLYSEDLNSKDDGHIYEVAPGAPLLKPFKNLAMRLKIGEAGIVRSPYGLHVMKRLPPPPPDKLETAEIMKRDLAADKVKMKHILLGWSDRHTVDPRGQQRSRADLEQLVPQVLGRLANGEPIETLMAELSEDPATATAGASYDVTLEANIDEPIKALSLRLKVGELGVVKSRFGLHIVKRIE